MSVTSPDGKLSDTQAAGIKGALATATGADTSSISLAVSSRRRQLLQTALTVTYDITGVATASAATTLATTLQVAVSAGTLATAILTNTITPITDADESVVTLA